MRVDLRYRLVQGSRVAAPWTVPARTLTIEPSALEIPDSPGPARIPLAYRLPMVRVPYEQFDLSTKWARFDSGKPVLLNLWASWCQPCLSELQEFTDRADEIRAAGIEVLALSVDGLKDDGSKAAAVSTARRIGLPFEVGRATPQLLRTLEQMHHRQIPMRRQLPLPTSFLIDANGQLAVIYKGPFSEVVDDDGHRIPRGIRYAVCEKAFAIYSREPYRSHFEFVEPQAPPPVRAFEPPPIVAAPGR